MWFGVLLDATGTWGGVSATLVWWRCLQVASHTSCFITQMTAPCNTIWTPNFVTTRIISSTNFNAQFNNNMYVTLLSSTCFGPWHTCCYWIVH